ncbi:MAG: 50S ribosomal protein L30e [Promethearchaeota archaeon]
MSSKIDFSRSKKAKKGIDFETNLKVAFKTGKIIYGKNQVLKALRNNPFKMLVIANNIPQELETQLNYYTSLLKDKPYIYKYKGSSLELGLALALPYWVSILGVVDPGDSDILSVIPKK